MAKKIDLSGVKEFLFNHGEKVALGICGAVALCLGVVALWSALGAGKTSGGVTYAAGMDKGTKGILARLPGGSDEPLPPEVLVKLKPDYYIWAPITSAHSPSPYSVVPDNAGDKRVNPQVLSIRNDPDEEKAKKYFDMKCVPGLVFVYEYTATHVSGLAPAGAGGAGAGGAGVQPPIDVPNMPIGGGAKGKLTYQRIGRPIRVVVVHAVFPMKDQVLEFQKALRFLSQKEFRDSPDDRPRPLGINVVRYKFKDGQAVNAKGEVVVAYDITNKSAVKSPALEKLLKEAFYDEEWPKAVEPYLFAGLVTPMPKLAFGQYPRFALEGFPLVRWPEEMAEMKQGPNGEPGKPFVPGGNKGGPNLPGLGKKGGKFPPKFRPGMPPMEGDQDPKGEPAANRTREKIERKKLQVLDKDLYARLYGLPTKDYNIFHPLGKFPPAKGTQGQNPNVGMPQNNQAADGKYFAPWDVAIAKPGVGVVPDGEAPVFDPNNAVPNQVVPMNVNPGGLGQAVADWDRDAVVRFIDPEVEPGYTYRYGIQVVLANPNFEKTKLVDHQRLATIPALLSKMEFTPAITIPQEYHLYAVDQQLLDSWTDPKIGGKTPVDPRSIKDQTPFQVHKWVPDDYNHADRKSYPIGDWAIAERVVVRKGERIGSPQVAVQVPVWDELKDSFYVPRNVDDPKAKGKKKLGIYLDLKKEVIVDNKKATEEAPVLVDFTGGKRFRPGLNTFEEESAVDALILTADGKLAVLNSRIDSDPENPEAVERQERVLTARHRVEEYLHTTSPKTAGPKVLPGVPGGPQ